MHKISPDVANMPLTGYPLFDNFLPDTNKINEAKGRRFIFAAAVRFTRSHLPKGRIMAVFTAYRIISLNTQWISMFLRGHVIIRIPMNNAFNPVLNNEAIATNRPAIERPGLSWMQWLLIKISHQMMLSVTFCFSSPKQLQVTMSLWNYYSWCLTQNNITWQMFQGYQLELQLDKKKYQRPAEYFGNLKRSVYSYILL